MRILWNNLWDLYSLTESQEDASYPAENTQDIRLVKVWRTQTASAATIAIDAGAGLTITCDAAAILAHNFTASAGICVQAATAPTFAAIAMSANVTWRDGPMVVYFSANTLRCWRFSFDELTLADGYYEVGRLFLGQYLQVDPSSLVEFPQEQVRTDNVQFSRDGQLYADEGICYKQLRYQFQEASASAKTLIETMWAGSAGVGKHKPLLLMNYDETFTVIEPLYCAIAEDIVFKHKTHDYWDWDLVLRECR